MRSAFADVWCCVTFPVTLETSIPNLNYDLMTSFQLKNDLNEEKLVVRVAGSAELASLSMQSHLTMIALVTKLHDQVNDDGDDGDDCDQPTMFSLPKMFIWI